MLLGLGQIQCHIVLDWTSQFGKPAKYHMLVNELHGT